MPEKRWEFPINEFGDRAFVRIVTEQGIIVDYAVRYAVMVDGQLRQAVLCDGSHDRGHCHPLDWEGNKLDRIWSSEGTDLGAAMTEAIDDIKEHWGRHRLAFLRRRP